MQNAFSGRLASAQVSVEIAKSGVMVATLQVETYRYPNALASTLEKVMFFGIVAVFLWTVYRTAHTGLYVQFFSGGGLGLTAVTLLPLLILLFFVWMARGRLVPVPPRATRAEVP